MIAYVKGEITFKSPTYIIIEAGGLGYQLNISINTYSKIEKLERVKLLTYFHVKEDSQTLYGFAEQAERSLFIHLISVSGIGPNTARILLSSLTADEIRKAILGEDVRTISSAKGIGPKTAKRLIVELKDKMLKEGGEEQILSSNSPNSQMREEALSALVALGFNKVRVQKALTKVSSEHAEISNVEIMIKLALKNLS